ncbi:MAG: uncharacterized protein QG632_253 [Candidatus Dependentiae bacterium]|nr:uncharacterized protein [Candidatus Dependentiae bacterium]
MKYIHYILPFFLVSACAPLSAEPANAADPERFDAASQYRIGKAYITFGHKYERALPWLQAAARQGHLDAQFIVGTLYYQGLGTQKDEAEGFKWFFAAANNGHAEAQYNLGLLYLDGKIIPQDLQLAIKWLEAAAEQGYAPAQFELGSDYLFGERGIPLDPQKGIYWLETIANNNEPESNDASGRAAYILGTLYLNGEHVTQSDAEGAKWCALATQKGSLYGTYHLGFLSMVGRGIEKNIPEAIDLFTYVTHHASEQDRDVAGYAAYCLARLYRDNTEIPQDLEKSFEWYTFAAEKDNAEALHDLDEIYAAANKRKAQDPNAPEHPENNPIITESTSHDTNLAESPEIP